MQSTRRKILSAIPLVAISPGLFAQTLSSTPRQTAGPFYPDNLPLDRDNDLIIVTDSITAAIGQILHLSGKVIDTRGRLVKGALVEIWQTDSNGRYIHSDDYQQGENDKNFQGYGLFQTDVQGNYRFRTIRPVAYGSGFGRRTPHIHMAVTSKNFKPLITQIYFGDEDNSKDGLWSRLSVSQQNILTVLPKPIVKSQINEQAVTFNIVLG